MLKEYSDVFEGLGTFRGVHKIHLKPDAVPVIHAPRRIPAALRDKLEKELKRMEDLGVIVKGSEPTDWVNSITAPEKQRTGALRVYLNPRDLNHAITREHYPLPTLKDLTLLLSGAECFSVLDATSGYWQIKLDDESSLLTNFQHAIWAISIHPYALWNTLSSSPVPGLPLTQAGKERVLYYLQAHARNEPIILH